MPGSFDFEPRDVPLASPAAAVRVCRYDPDASGDARYAILPNVRCERIEHREGPEPPAARFSYQLDGAGTRRAPADFGALWPVDASGPYVVRDDDRLAVLAVLPDGSARILFDGFAQSPRVDLSARSQRVSFLALGAAVRCWDEPIGRRLQRQSDDPEGGGEAAVDLPARFNPDGKPNCTPDGADVGPDDPASSFPVFLDPDLDRDPDPRAYWTLGKFARYVLGVHNTQEYVENPDFEHLDALLQSRTPDPGAAYADLGDEEGDGPAGLDVVVRDFDATGMPWPEALAAQLALAGFGMRFVTDDDGSGSPAHRIEFYRKDAGGGMVRDVLLPRAGADLDPSRCNVASLRIERDARSIVNAVTVETARRRVEASFVLAPGFTPAAGDESAANRVKFLRANLADASSDDRRKYRVFVADEAGDGHWDAPASSWSTDALDLSALFPDADDGSPTYVKRLRPGSRRLITRDAQGRPLRAELALSRNYQGGAPAVWDGTGDWQPITGGWELLEDRLGIYVSVDDPESWPVGDYAGPSPQEPSLTLRGVTSQSAPSGPNGRFVLRLTTVVEDDLMLPATVDARPASPTSFTRRRRVDARDHFAMETVAAGSRYNPGDEPLAVRDDSPRALAWARQLRAAHEAPPLSGEATLPGVVAAYRVGDRIARVGGRDVGLRSNLGAEQGEPAVYPVVSALIWDFAGDRQATILRLSDERAG